MGMMMMIYGENFWHVKAQGDASCMQYVGGHRTVEYFGLEGTLKTIQFQLSALERVAT